MNQGMRRYYNKRESFSSNSLGAHILQYLDFASLLGCSSKVRIRANSFGLPHIREEDRAKIQMRLQGNHSPCISFSKKNS
jgi:hypothetical protein